MTQSYTSREQPKSSISVFYKDICTSVTAVLFTTTKKWNQPNTNKQIEKENCGEYTALNEVKSCHYMK